MFRKFAFGVVLVAGLVFSGVASAESHLVEIWKVGDITPPIAYACFDADVAKDIVAGAVVSGEEADKRLFEAEAAQQCGPFPFPFEFRLYEVVEHFVDYEGEHMTLWRMRMNVEDPSFDFYLWGKRYRGLRLGSDSI